MTENDTKAKAAAAPWLAILAGWTPDSQEALAATYRKTINGRRFEAQVGGYWNGDADQVYLILRGWDDERDRSRSLGFLRDIAEAKTVLAGFETFTVPEEWLRQRAREDEEVALKGEASRLFAQDSTLWGDLGVLGIAKVVVNFSGSGDSGGIDLVEAFGPKDSLAPHVALPEDLEEKITHAWEVLFEHSFDNEGCHGDLTVDVEERTAKLNVGFPQVDWEAYDWTPESAEAS